MNSQKSVTKTGTSWRIKTIVAATAFIALPWALAEPPVKTAEAIDQKLIADAKEGSEIMKNLTYLSDVIGPRMTGSANLKRANDWAYDVMKNYGLTNVRLEGWEIPVGWERGTVTAKLVEPDNGKTITAAAMAWTPGTKGKITGDVVFVNARTLEELKAYEGKLKNAIVLRGVPSRVAPITDLSTALGGPFADAQQKGGGRGQAKGAGKADDKAKGEDKSVAKGDDKGGKASGRAEGFNTRGGDFMRNRREMSEFLRKEGVAVLLTDSGKPHGLLNMTGGWGSADRVNAVEPLPTLFVTHDHYAMLHRLATRADKSPTRMEIEVTNKTIPGPIPVYNTIGEIRGSEKPDEVVVCGAHIDSWDLGQGTTDNGTGTCVVLEAARILAKSGIVPKRTIRFALFSGEEQGLHGSREYVKRHEADLPKHSAAIIHDTGTGKIIGMSLMGREVLKPIMESELACLKDLGVAEFSTRSMGGSDHQSFDGKGVPGFMFRQDPAEYRLTHHSQSDTLDKAREADLIQGAQVMAVIAARIANRDEMLPRDKPKQEGRGKAESKKADEKKADPKKDD